VAIIRGLGDKHPRILPGAFIAETATLIGDVEIGPQASVWYGCVLRADVGFIRIGARTNLQDQCSVHMTTETSNTWIGDDVTIGHAVVIHGASVLDGALIGMGAILMDNAEVGEEAVVAAGCLVPPRMIVPPRVLVRGRPAVVVRPLTEDEQLQGRRGAVRYLELSRQHQELKRPPF
jgi:carbonic anhydrase/acetyltransferase-like protein (isoleucine patch superfamily)